MLFALLAPASIPSSPNTNTPPREKKVKVKKSPRAEGRVKGVMSGRASVRPLAKVTLVGFSAARLEGRGGC